MGAYHLEADWKTGQEVVFVALALALRLALSFGCLHAGGTLPHIHRQIVREQVFVPKTILDRLALMLNIHWNK